MTSEATSEEAVLAARARRRAELARKPILRRLAPGEWAEMLKGAEPPTDDDVPFKFPVKVPLKNDR